jgi:fatty aldehyde-generating acyl-ACP reductase
LTNPGEATLAVIGHLESLDAYRSAFEAARGRDLPPLDAADVRTGLRHSGAIPLCDFVLRSARGHALCARYIDIGLVIEPGFSGGRSAVERVRQACHEARACGARLAALGGFASIVAENDGTDLERSYGLGFTTGNTLTAATIAAQVAELDPSAGARVTVVGAAGDVGSGVCRLLHARGQRLTLVGRSPRPLLALSAEIGDAPVAEWDAAAPMTDVAVLVASSGRGEIALDTLPSGSIVLDAGHPPNATPALHVRYAAAGRVVYRHPPECDLQAILSDRYPAGQSHACVAEAVVLGFERRYESYSRGRGRIHPDRAAEILCLAERHGVRPAPLAYQGSAS